MAHREDKPEVLVKLGQRIRELRKARRLKQDELGELLGLSVNQIARLEAGLIGTPIRRLETIAQTLGVRVVDLFADETPDMPKVVVGTTSYSASMPFGLPVPTHDENVSEFEVDERLLSLLDEMVVSHIYARGQGKESLEAKRALLALLEYRTSIAHKA